MKAKFLTLLMSVLILGSPGIDAQTRRLWNFTRGLSEETVTNLNADTYNWASDVKDENGVTTRWKNRNRLSGTEPLEANGEIIYETDDLFLSTGRYDQNSILISNEKLRLSRANSTITFPRLKNGQIITIVGSSANVTAESRGIAPVQDYIKYVGDTNALTDGKCIFLGSSVPGSQGIYTFKWQVETSETDPVDVQFVTDPEGGIDFLTFAIDISLDSPESELSAISDIFIYKAKLKVQMNKYIEALRNLYNTGVRNTYTNRLKQAFNLWNSKFHSLVDDYYLSGEVSLHLSDATTYLSNGTDELRSIYNQALDADRDDCLMLPCRYNYVLVCDDWTDSGLSRPGAGALFGDDYFLDVTGGGVSPAKRSVDLSIADGELVTQEIASKYGGYGNHLCSLRLKNEQDVISMNVVAGSKLIFFYNNNGVERYPLLCTDRNMYNPITAQSTMSATVDEKLQRMEWIAPEDMVVYIGSYGGDIFLSYIIVEATGLRTVSVNLPHNINASDYQNMWLDMINAESGQRLHYVTSSQNSYIFRNIPDNSKWNLVLRNERGDVFGQIDDITVDGNDVEVTFDNLIKPQNVKLIVTTPDGKDVTSQTQLTWSDEEGNELTILKGLLPGTKLNYKIVLPKELAMQYVAPAVTEYTVADSGNEIKHQLEAIKQVELTGAVKDVSTKMALMGAIISASQTFGGKYDKTVTAKTDSKGNYKLLVNNVPTTLNISATDYISQTIGCDSLMTGDESITIPDISLKPITGASVSLDFTYTPSVADGETADVQNWYKDYNNVTYTIYNKTQQRQVNGFNIQHPVIVILDGISEGDELELTAVSKNSAFVPVTATATIDSDLRGDVLFNILELGKVRASFDKNGNKSVVGSLYNNEGKLLKSYDFNNATLTIDDLADGKYTLLVMGASKLFNTIYDLNKLPQTGLVEGSDYVQCPVQVKSGTVSVIDIDEVPALDESKLYYTNDNSYFTVNKLSLVSGNYLTLSASLDFKPEYADNVKNVNFIVDLPESCPFVDNSVMLGNSTSGYALAGSRLIIPMDNYSDRIRFCVTPTLGGNYVSSAFAQFEINGETITQPVGSVNFAAKDLTINVPSTSNSVTIPVSGVSVGASSIEVYDGDVMIGQATSLENGVWATTCELNQPYNLSKHSITAKVKTKTGLELVSETKECQYDFNSIQVSKVIMYHWNSDTQTTYESVFDFLNPKATANQWTLNHHDKRFTYTIEFTENDPEKVSNVILYVHTADGSIVPCKAVYDEEKGLWSTEIYLGNTSGGYYPVNCSVDFDYVSDAAIDNNQLLNEYRSLADLQDQIISQTNEIDEIYNQIKAELNNDPVNLDLIDDLNKDLESLLGISFSSSSIENIDEEILYNNLLKFQETYGNNSIEGLLNSSITAIDYDIPEEDGAGNISVTSCEKFNLSTILEDSTFEQLKVAGGKTIFAKATDNLFILLDFEENICYQVTFASDSEAAAFSPTKANDVEGIQKHSKTIGEKINTAIDILDKILSVIDDVAEHIEGGIKFAQEGYGSTWLQLRELKRLQAKGEYIAPQRITLLELTCDGWEAECKGLKGLRSGLTNFKAQALGKLFGVCGIISSFNDCKNDLDEFIRLYYSVPNPCDKDKSKAEKIRNNIRLAGIAAGIYYVGNISSDVCALFGIGPSIVAAPATAGSSLGVALASIGKIALSYGITALYQKTSEKVKARAKNDISSLKCNNNCGEPGMPPCPDPTPTNSDGQHPSGSPDNNVRVDPSGYVYEGVPTNRLEGVTATVYYKETVEDMYGDLHENIVKWNAEEFGQENPLTTDKNGFYRWDVPQGLWQVKYEKEGYETTYSEWLPVPPPQLDVNIAMKQAVQPKVVDARAFEDAVEVEFDKYMMPALLNTENITVTVNGQPVDGTIELLNEEASYDGNTETFASKVRFNADEYFNANELTLKVRNDVESYAGVRMQDNYYRTLAVELEVRKIVCDSVTTVGYGENGVITVKVIPAAASAGKTLNVKSSSPAILATYVDNVEIDEDGEAEIIVKGELPGSAALIFSLEGYDLTAMMNVNVKQIETVATPTANIASGTTVGKGTLISLSCSTIGSTIYYTLDGSCPCADTSSRMVYDGTPIIISENVTILAMATAPDMKESEVAEFIYFVDDLTGNDEITIDEELKIFPIPVHDKLNVTAGGNIIKNVIVTDLSGAVVTKSTSPSTYISINVSSLMSGIYVISVETENRTYSRKIIKIK